jgi:hypothetical protein
VGVDHVQVDTTWAVSAVPDLVVGVRDGDPDYVFFRVTGVAMRPDGTIVVVHGGMNEIRTFDGEGRFLRRIGREGQGPGEFSGPQLIPSRTYDSLFVGDASRFTVLTAHDSIRVLGPMRFPLLPAVALEGGIVLFGPEGGWTRPTTAGIATGRIRAHRFVDVGKPEAPGVLVARVTPQSTIAAPLPNGGSAGVAIPFTVQPSHAAARRGIYVAQGMDPEVLEYDLQGNLVRRIELPLSRRPVPASAYTDAVARRRSETRRILERVGQPPGQTYPVVSGLVADSEGGVWVQVYSWERGAQTRWLAVSEAGEVIGEVSTPPGFEVHQVGPDFLLGIHRDDLEVETIVLHRLRRGRPG